MRLIGLPLLICLVTALAPLWGQELPDMALEKAVFEKVNAFRLEQGLPALAYSEDLATLAREHSVQMALGKLKLGHDGFSARFSQSREKNPAIRSMGENVAYNFPQEELAGNTVQSWLKSPVHRANILRAGTLTGVGVARASNGTYFFTQIFAKD